MSIRTLEVGRYRARWRFTPDPIKKYRRCVRCHHLRPAEEFNGQDQCLYCRRGGFTR